MSPQSNIDEVVASLGDLPAMPKVVAEVLRLTEDTTVPMSEVSQIIEKDPALTAKLLKISNSPYYGMRQVVGTLKLALVILGTQEVRNIVMGVAVIDGLRDSRTEELLKSDDFWKHSVLVGGFAKQLGNYLELGLQGEDFVSGLLHDIGKLVLLQQLYDEYEALYRKSRLLQLPLVELEREAFGFDHADAAAALARHWNLPETLADAVWCHHPREDRSLKAAKDPRLAALVRIANAAAHEDLSAGSPEDVACVNDEEAWGIVEEIEEMTPLQRLDVMREFMDEWNQAPPLVLD